MFYLLAIIALGVLILVHEAGHMWVARLCGMRVDKFSIFFGPPILRWRGKKTTYQLAMVPLGGYVQIAGMNPQEQLPEDDPGSYQNKAAWKRFAAIFAGPGINYLFAMVLVAVVTLGWGLPTTHTAIGGVTKDFPAAAAGMKARDVVVSVDGVAVTGTGVLLRAIRASEGKPLRFRVRRDGKMLDLLVTPKKVKKGFKIGVAFQPHLKFHEASVGASLVYAAYYPFAKSAKVLGNLADVITRKTSGSLGGPIEIVRQLKMSFEQGWVVALFFLAMLNVLLGLFNLLPLPALDGGRLIFLVFEIVSRRKVNQRVENAVHTAGFLLLVGLLLYVTYGDVGRIFK